MHATNTELSAPLTGETPASLPVTSVARPKWLPYLFGGLTGWAVGFFLAAYAQHPDNFNEIENGQEALIDMGTGTAAAAACMVTIWCASKCISKARSPVVEDISPV
ncbi:MAG: hypothetical protein Q7V63_09980 [Gammaproteobacteria bacterium]|nr:hypothetical protein [Gammaproteobacteria bacterium]